MKTSRRRRHLGLPLLLCLLSLTAAAGAQETDSERAPHGRTPAALAPYSRAAEPYRRFFLTPPEYRGPSRDHPFAEGLASIPIGVLAPLEGTLDDELGSSLLHGVELAIEEANAAGGYGGLPFGIVARNDQQLWGSSSNTLVQFAYRDRVWALIGSIDSNSTHVALRAALKAELPMVNVGSTDPTVTETGIPWIIRTTPDDRQTGYRLASHVFEERGATRVAVVRASDRYGRFGIREFRDAARRLQRPLALEILFQPGTESYDDVFERVAAAEVDAIVLWASAEDAARIVVQARQAGLPQPIFGTDRIVSKSFLELAGDAAEGIEATAWMDPARDDGEWRAFQDRFAARFGRPADVWAAYAYDAAQLTVEAIRSAGLNHARIMDALGEIREYDGIAGTMVFDTTWTNVSEPLVVRVAGGRFVPLHDRDETVATVPDGEPLRVGLLADSTTSGESFRVGAEMAAAEINADGGIAGRPLELVRLTSDSPWRDGASLVARLSATPDLLALVGAEDGALAHVAAQVATRRQLPYVSSSPEVSLTRAGVPWVLRGVPSDLEQARFLLTTGAGSPDGTRTVLVVPDGREGRERLAALREACSELGVEVVAEVTPATVPLRLPDSDTLLLWLDAEAALDFLSTHGAVIAPSHVLGSQRLAQDWFLERAPSGLDVVVPMPIHGAASAAPPRGELAERLGYDLVSLIAHAARVGGGAPIDLRDALLTGPTFVGRTGALRFDRNGNRIAELTSATLPLGVPGPPGVTS